MLIRAAEDAARKKGCYYLCLGTMDFQARPLYEKHGFRVFTINKDVPRGHDSGSLSKRLDRDFPEYVPTNNTAAKRYEVKVGGKEDADIIGDGLDRYCDMFVQDKHEYITLSKKLVDKGGNIIAAVVAGVEGDDTAYIDGVWVEEHYRGQGIGSYLIGVIEREAKDAGAYVVLSYCCDWVSDFFFKSGYKVRGALDDYPKGHRAFELEKRL